MALLFCAPGAHTCPLGPNHLCIGGPGTFRFAGPGMTNNDGFEEFSLELGAPPLTTSWLPDTQWTIQAVFRDLASTQGVGVTDALIVRWGP